MWRSVVIGVVLAGLLAGCTVGGAHSGPNGLLTPTSGGARPDSLTITSATPVYVRARSYLVKLRERTMQSPPIPAVASLGCVLIVKTNRPTVASCQGTTTSGDPMDASFYVGQSGRLRVPCVSWDNGQSLYHQGSNASCAH